MSDAELGKERGGRATNLNDSFSARCRATCNTQGRCVGLQAAQLPPLRNASLPPLEQLRVLRASHVYDLSAAMLIRKATNLRCGAASSSLFVCLLQRLCMRTPCRKMFF